MPGQAQRAPNLAAHLTLPIPPEQLISLGTELARLLLELAGRAQVRPVGLEEWRQAALGACSGRSRSYRDRVGQALAEAVALAGPGATTAALTPELVGRFGARPGAAATTNGLLRALRTACSLAAVRGWLPTAALDRAAWRVYQGPQTRARHHPREAIARVLGSLEEGRASWEGGRLHALACTYAYTGLRLREALRLELGDVDLTRGFLFVRPGADLKTAGSAAPVPCPRVLVEVLEGWVGRVGARWVFPNLGKTGPWSGGTYGKRPTDKIVAAGRAIGVEGFTPLSLRHSLATHYAGYWGLSDKQIQQILRHTTVMTQRHYVHADLANLAELVQGFRFDLPEPARGRRRRPPRRAWCGPRRRRPGAARG